MATPHHVRRLTGGVLLLVAGLTLTVSLWPPAASAQADQITDQFAAAIREALKVPA